MAHVSFHPSFPFLQMRVYYYTFMSVAFPLGNDGVDRVASHRNQRNGLVQVTFTGWTPSAGSNESSSSSNNRSDDAAGDVQMQSASSPSSSPLLRDVSLIMKRIQFQKAAPIKVNAIHGCSPDPFVGKIISPIVRPLLSFHSSSRIRIHYGMYTCTLPTCLFVCFVLRCNRLTWLSNKSYAMLLCFEMKRSSSANSI